MYNDNAGWRPTVGYKPVDTAAIDSLRPLHQRKMIELVNRRQQMEQNQKKQNVSYDSDVIYVCLCVYICVCTQILG